MDRRQPSATLLALAAVAALAGAVFALQGIGVPIGQSFMIGDVRWTAIGIALLAGAGAAAWRELRRR